MIDIYMHFYILPVVYLLNEVISLVVNRPKGLTFGLKSLIYFFINMYLDLILVQSIKTGDQFRRINVFPIYLISTLIFYFVIRYWIRDQYQYRYHTKIDHPNTQIYLLGYYYDSFAYNLSELFIRWILIYNFLTINIVLVYSFLLSLNAINRHVYYRNTTDTTHNLFQNVLDFFTPFIKKNK